LPKKYEKVTGPGVFFRTLATSVSPDAILEAYRKEASRQVGEMQRWMDYHIKEDPYNMLEHWTENVFPLVRQAVKYRMRVYNRNRVFDKLKFDRLEATAKSDTKALEEIAESWRETEDEQIALCWRIKKIHLAVRELVQLQLDKGEAHPFEEYEYEAEMT